jgi:hypothetical protein
MMKPFRFNSIGGALTLLVLATSQTGCKKYPDGPGLSLNPRNARVANHWVIAKATEDGQDVTNQYDHYDLFLEKDGDARLDASYYFFGTQIVVITDGTWMFTNHDANLQIDYENDGADVEYQILRLTEKELWLRQVGADLELQLKSAE